MVIKILSVMFHNIVKYHFRLEIFLKMLPMRIPQLDHFLICLYIAVICSIFNIFLDIRRSGLCWIKQRFFVQQTTILSTGLLFWTITIAKKKQKHSLLLVWCSYVCRLLCCKSAKDVAHIIHIKLKDNILSNPSLIFNMSFLSITLRSSVKMYWLFFHQLQKI